MKRLFCFLILGFLIMYGVSPLTAANTAAKTFVLIETPNLDKGVYDITKGANSAPLFIPGHTHPNTGNPVPATTITCDRMENIYVTFERDFSVMPETVTAGRLANYYSGTLPCQNTRTFSVTYAHPAGGNRTENFELTWDVNQGVLFYKRNVDRKASYASDDRSDHPYTTHIGHLAAVDGLDKQGNISPYFKTALCYPHSFWGTVPAGVDRTPVQLVDEPCEGETCGNYNEPWGQQVTGNIWLPNGVWYHDDHTDRTTAGRRGRHIDPVGKSKRFCFSVVDIYVALEKQEKAGTPEYSNESLISNKPIEDAQAVYWQLAQCADNCDSSTGNTVTAGSGLKPTSYEVVMGPSGNIYMYSPYLSPSIQYLKADPSTGAPLPGAAWQAYDWKGTDAGHTINVNCNNDLSDMKHIGVATKTATQDWVYLSSDDKFAVGDQFSGHGGVLYCGNKQPGGALKVMHTPDIAQNHSVAATGPGQSYPNHQNMINVPVPNGVQDFSADGMGSFYYITKKAFGAWRVATYVPAPPVWSNASDIGHPLCLKAKAHLIQDFKTTLHIREFDHATKQVVPPSQTQIAYSLNAGYRTNMGWDIKDDTGNATPVPLPGPQPNLTNKVVDHTHVDIATVVDASPPINGECKVDIVPKDMSIKYANNIDFIPVEDGQAYEWEFENWKTDYTKDGLDRDGNPLPVDNENGSVVDMVAPSANDPYDIHTGPLGVQEKNPLHFNWGNQSRKTDINNNGYTGGFASNVVGDASCPSPQAGGNQPGQAVDSREFEWRLYCVSKKGMNFATIDSTLTAELVAKSGWKNVQQNGFKFSHKFIGQGIYELQLRARYNTYDYRRAGIIPVFTRGPDDYIDIDGGNPGGGVQDTSITAPFSNNMVYYCKSATGSNFPESTVAKRLIFVGQKVPDYGCWVAGRTYVYSRKGQTNNNGTPPYRDEDDWKLRGSVGSYFSGGPVATIEKFDQNNILTSEPVEIYEGQNMWFETVLAVKYFKNVDEQTLNDLKNENMASTSSGNASYDLNEKVHDLFSGVVPGSVTFELKLYDGAGGISLSVESRAAVKLVENWTSNPDISQNDCSGIIGSRTSNERINFRFDTQKESFGAGNISNMINNVGTGNWDLSWVTGGSGGVSQSKYVPDLATIGLYYLDKSDFTTTTNGTVDNSEPVVPGNPNLLRGDSVNMRYVAHGGVYDTPTVGRIGTAMFDENCLRAVLKVRGDIKEWNLTPAGVQIDPAASGGYLTNPAAANMNVALSYETNNLVNGVTQSNVVLLELPIDIMVNDTSPPATTIEYFNEGKMVNGVRHKFTPAAASGDLFCNDIIVKVEDNNPFYSIYQGYSDATIMPNAAPYNPDFSIAVGKTYKPLNGTNFTPEPNVNLNWYDLTGFAIANPVELVPAFSFMNVTPPTPPTNPVLYSRVKGRKSLQVFTIPAYSFSVDPSGGWVFSNDWNAGNAPMSRPVHAMCVYATAVDGSGNGPWKTSPGGPACIPDKDPNFESLLVSSSTTFQPNPVYTAYPAGVSVLDSSLLVEDNDPPEIYFAVSSNITNYAFTVQNMKYTGQDDSFTQNQSFNSFMGNHIGGKLNTQQIIDKEYSGQWLSRMVSDYSLMKKYILDDRGGALSDNANPSGRTVPGNYADPSFAIDPTIHPPYMNNMVDPAQGGAGMAYVAGYLPVGPKTVFTVETAGGSPQWGISPAGGQGGSLTSEVNLVPMFRNPSTGKISAISVIESSRFSIRLRAVDNLGGVINLADPSKVIFTNETPSVQNIIPSVDAMGFLKTQDPSSNDYVKTFIAQSSSGDPDDYSVWSLTVFDRAGNSRKIFVPLNVVPADFKVHTLGRRDQSEKGSR